MTEQDPHDPTQPPTGAQPPPPYGAPPPPYGAPPPPYGAPPPPYGAPPPPYGAPPPPYGAAPPPPGAYGGPSVYPPDPGAPYGRDARGRPLSNKSKLVAGLLQLLVGWTGAGRFYTGHTGMAIAMLFTCGGLGIWALIDGIMLLVRDDWTDANGLYLRA
jgi:TM2 domain-containing membrane protein YozV